MKRFFLTTLLALICIATFADSKITLPDTYNYNRALDEYEAHNYGEALKYFDKELKDNPRNGYAYCWMAVIYLDQGEKGRALSASDNAIKYIPKKDPYYLAVAHFNRAGIYLSLGDTIQALADYDTSIKIAPTETFAYNGRAKVYRELKQYDLSEADYKKIIEVDPSSTLGYIGLGTNYNAQERWQEAIDQLNQLIILYSDFAQAYALRAESYIGLEDWSRATDDLIKAFSIDGDNKAFCLTIKLKEPAFDMMIVKLKIQADKNPNEALWPVCIGYMYESKKQYEKAITYYEEANAREVSDAVLSQISVCYDELGDFEQALKYIDKAIELDPTDESYILSKTKILLEMGEKDDILGELNEIQQEYPEIPEVYLLRGGVKLNTDDLDGAIEDLTTAIMLNPENVTPYSWRGDAYTKQGKTDLAAADYRKVIELEDSPEKYEYSMFSYHALGDDDKAIAVMDTIISRSDDLRGDYYQAACLYSRMENKKKALEYLERALEEGYVMFNPIRMDYDMDLLRDTEEFNSLLEKYETQHKAKFECDDNETIVGEEVVTEVPFTKESGGLCRVKCNINDLPLYFIFDTGASTVSMSKVEADFMFKNGYLTEKDVIGNSYFGDANGNVNPGTVINLRQVEFGGLVLENVQATVVPNQRAPLLLGQTVLSRLGKIEIDNTNHILKITHTKL